MSRKFATVRQVAALLGAIAQVDPAAPIRRLGRAIDATPDTLIFATDDASMVAALASPAVLILCPRETFAATGDPRLLEVKDPRLAFAQVYHAYFDERGEAGVHPAASIHLEARIGPGCEIGAGAIIEAGAELGERCIIGPRVVIHDGTRLGARVRVQAGAVLGSDGFGYARGPAGYIRFPQIGTLVIGDDVEIGANTTIDRGALGETRIGRGTKIDNLVHIAHNCIVGEDVILAAQAGIAGSCVIEDNAMLGGQVGLGERVTIGRGVILGGQGGVLPGKRLDGAGQIFWGTPARPVREYLRDLVRLRKG